LTVTLTELRDAADRILRQRKKWEGRKLVVPLDPGPLSFREIYDSHTVDSIVFRTLTFDLRPIHFDGITVNGLYYGDVFFGTLPT
jgi:acyl dehydratase